MKSRAAGCFAGLLAAFMVGVAGSACAAPEEIQVYEDDLVKPGGFGLDLHNNYVISGDSLPDHVGGQASEHAYRLTPEFYYGLTPSLEAGLYVLSAVDNHGVATIGGEKVRLKYIAPKADPSQTWYWGVNFEIGKVSRRYDENPWNAELKGIYGIKTGKWDLAINANVDWTVSGPHPQQPMLNISTKVGYEVFKGVSFGLESYNDIGDHRSFGRFGQQEQDLYAVVDTDVRGWNLNLGVGRGWTAASDHWVAKAVIGVPFG